MTSVSCVVLGLVSEGTTTPYGMKWRLARSVGCEPTLEPTQIRDTGLLRLFFGETLTTEAIVALAPAWSPARARVD